MIRESTTYPNSYGLALKAYRVPHSVKVKPEDPLSAQLVRHFLIERTETGFQIRGYDFEPIFGNLTDLVAHHCRNPVALPCALRLPGYAPVPTAEEVFSGPVDPSTKELAPVRDRSYNRSRSRTPNRGQLNGYNHEALFGRGTMDNPLIDEQRHKEIYRSNTELAPANTGILAQSMRIDSNSMSPLRSILPKGAACMLYYLGSLDVEQLSGPNALRMAVDRVFGTEFEYIRPIEVTFHVNADGITITDVMRRSFFRRHHPIYHITYMDLDPNNRSWNMHIDGMVRSFKILGFVARISDHQMGNRCHVLTECERGEPAEIVANFVN
ncbi:Tensin-3, partial [Cichlidogyrus casuarinus]